MGFSVHDVVFPRLNPKYEERDPDSKKHHWVKCGVAFITDGEKIAITIDSIPINFDGQLVIFLKPKARFKACTEHGLINCKTCKE